MAVDLRTVSAQQGAAPSLAIIAPEELRRELVDHADPNQEGALIAARSIASEGREPTHLSRFRRRSAMPEMGHEHAFPLIRPNGRCRIRQRSLGVYDWRRLVRASSSGMPRGSSAACTW
jgi:hypothetical protein